MGHKARTPSIQSDTADSEGALTYVRPSLETERAQWQQGKLRVAGVDEVGIGSLSGPVVACALIIPVDCRMIDGVRDSKTLTPKEREHLYQEITRQAVAVGLGAASVREIDSLNVLKASHLAMRRALARLGMYDYALIDGRPIKDSGFGPHICITGGDGSCYAIACSSIVAKVTRDRLMRRLARRFPGYGWETNVGYGTREHLEAMQKIGLTPLHRRSFAPVRELISLAPTCSLPPAPSPETANASR